MLWIEFHLRLGCVLHNWTIHWQKTACALLSGMWLVNTLLLRALALRPQSHAHRGTLSSERNVNVMRISLDGAHQSEPAVAVTEMDHFGGGGCCVLWVSFLFCFLIMRLYDIAPKRLLPILDLMMESQTDLSLDPDLGRY